MESGFIRTLGQAMSLAVMGLVTLTATYQTRMLLRGGAEGITGQGGRLAESLNDNRRILGSYANCGMFQDI